MPQHREGVKKKQTGFYNKLIQKLEADVERRLLQLAKLEQQRKLGAEREQVLVDLVLQQEHHLEHLTKLKAPIDSEMADLDELLNLKHTPEPPASHTAASALTVSQYTAAMSDPSSCTGAAALTRSASLNSGMNAALGQVGQWLHAADNQDQALLSQQLQASHQLQLYQAQLQQQQPLMQLPQLQKGPNQQSGTVTCGSNCSSETAVSPTGSAQSSSGRFQYIQSLLRMATVSDWDRAMSMTADDWCDYHGFIAKRIKLLLELVEQKCTTTAEREQHLESTRMTAAQRSAFVVSALAQSCPASSSSSIDPEVELEAWVDDFNTLVNLAVLHNPLPVRDTARRNCQTKQYQDVVPLSFWAEATAKTGFLEEQVQQLRFGYNEFWRILGLVHSKQQQLVSSVASSTAASAPTPWGMRRQTGAAAAAAATAPAQERDDLLKLLNEHMARWQTAAQLLLQFYCNTMTRDQFARMLVACWPYFPRMGSLVGAVAEINEPGAFQRLEDQMQRLRSQHSQQVNRRRLQLEKQRQEYWRRLVVLREQQMQEEQQQQQLQQRQPFVLQPFR